MTFMTRLSLSLFLGFLFRGELNLMLVSLTTATTASVTSSLLGAQLDQTLLNGASSMLGADLVVTGHQPIDGSWQEESRRLGLKSVEIAEFSSMLVENERMLLVNVRAVPGEYPLRGHISVAKDESLSEILTSSGPGSGEIWAESEVIGTLGIHLGEMIVLGQKPMRLTRILIRDPARTGGLSSLSPRVVIPLDALPETGILGPGSHVNFQVLFAGPPKAISIMRSWLSSRMSPGQTVQDLEDNRPTFSKTAQSTERFLAITSVFATILSGIAVSMSAGAFARKHYDLTALLRCLGLSRQRLLVIFCLELVYIMIPTTIAGLGSGLLIESLMQSKLANLADIPLEPLDKKAWLLAAGTAPIILLAFATAPMLSTRHLSPFWILRQEVSALPHSGWSVQATAVLLVSLLLSLKTGDIKLTGLILLGGILITTVLSFLGLSLIKFIPDTLSFAPPAIKLGFRRLSRNPRLTMIQLIGFSTTLASLMVMTHARDSLLDDWKSSAPEHAPTHFIINLFDQDLDSFAAITRSLGITMEKPYPIVRGRLVRINGQDARERAAGKSRAEGAIQRDLALTFSDRLPADNRILEGEWGTGPGTDGISVESELAKQLGIGPGDQVSFAIEGQLLTVGVASLRQVHWDQMTPNFYFIFPKGLIDRFSRTWMTSLTLGPEGQSRALRLAESFPAASLIDIGKVTEQIKSVLKSMTDLVRPMFILGIFGTILVLLAGIRASRASREKEALLMNVFGAKRWQIRKIDAAEFLCLGFLSGLLAVILAEGIRLIIYRFWLLIPFEPDLRIAAITPLLSALGLAILGGWAATSKVTPTTKIRGP